MVICLERGADLHMAQLMPLPLTVSCSSKIQIGLTFLVPAHLGSPGQRAVKRMYGAWMDSQLPTAPVNMTLLAFAADRCAKDRYLLQGQQCEAGKRWDRLTDRQTDTRQFHRTCKQCQ